jgi:hypothetical protein
MKGIIAPLGAVQLKFENIQAPGCDVMKQAPPAHE